jgi:hypothetical protein
MDAQSSMTIPDSSDDFSDNTPLTPQTSSGIPGVPGGPPLVFIHKSSISDHHLGRGATS